LDECVARLEPPLAAEAIQELDAEDLAVKIDIGVEQVRLHEHPPPGAESRAHAHVHRGACPIGARDIHAVPGTHELLVRDDVGGREPERAASPIPYNNL